MLAEHDWRIVAENRALTGRVAVAALLASGVLTWRTAMPTPLLGHLVMVFGLIPLVVIDLVDRRLPREFSYPIAAFSVAALLIGELLGSRDATTIVGIGGGAVLFVALLLGLALVSRGGMGSGDIRLAPLLGANLGYHAISNVPIALFAAAVLALLAVVPGLISKQTGLKSSVPFGPFLALGTMVTIALFA